MFWWVILIIAIWFIRKAPRAPACDANDGPRGWGNGYYWFADGVVQIFAVDEPPFAAGMHGNYYHMQNGYLQHEIVSITTDGRVRFDPYHRRIGGRIASFLQDYQIVQLLTDGCTDTILT